jgi:C_GCAxxG_C_C family probable redox protein
MDTNDLEKKAHDLGFGYEGRYGNCAQCTIAAVQDTLGVRDDGVFKSASALGGGIGKLCDGPCGGYSGGAMMIGSFWGRTRDNFGGDAENKARGNRLTVELHRYFLEEFGSVICRDIHLRIFGRTFDMYDKDDMHDFNEAGAHLDKCTSIVAKAAARTVRLIGGELESIGGTPGDDR